MQKRDFGTSRHQKLERSVLIVCVCVCVARFVVHGLIPGESYVFRVQAVNVFGLSEESQESTVIAVEPALGEEESFTPICTHVLINKYFFNKQSWCWNQVLPVNSRGVGRLCGESDSSPHCIQAEPWTSVCMRLLLWPLESYTHTDPHCVHRHCAPCVCLSCHPVKDHRHIPELHLMLLLPLHCRSSSLHVFPATLFST